MPQKQTARESVRSRRSIGMGDPVHKSLREKRQTETKEEYQRASFEFDPAPLKYYGKQSGLYFGKPDLRTNFDGYARYSDYISYDTNEFTLARETEDSPYFKMLPIQISDEDMGDQRRSGLAPNDLKSKSAKPKQEQKTPKEEKDVPKAAVKVAFESHHSGIDDISSIKKRQTSLRKSEAQLLEVLSKWKTDDISSELYLGQTSSDLRKIRQEELPVQKIQQLPMNLHNRHTKIDSQRTGESSQQRYPNRQRQHEQNHEALQGRQRKSKVIKRVTINDKGKIKNPTDSLTLDSMEYTFPEIRHNGYSAKRARPEQLVAQDDHQYEPIFTKAETKQIVEKQDESQRLNVEKEVVNLTRRQNKQPKRVSKCKSKSLSLNSNQSNGIKQNRKGRPSKERKQSKQSKKSRASKTSKDSKDPLGRPNKSRQSKNKSKKEEIIENGKDEHRQAANQKLEIEDHEQRVAQIVHSEEEKLFEATGDSEARMRPHSELTPSTYSFSSKYLSTKQPRKIHKNESQRERKRNPVISQEMDQKPKRNRVNKTKFWEGKRQVFSKTRELLGVVGNKTLFEVLRLNELVKTNCCTIVFKQNYMQGKLNVRPYQTRKFDGFDEQSMVQCGLCYCQFTMLSLSCDRNGEYIELHISGNGTFRLDNDKEVKIQTGRAFSLKNFSKLNMITVTFTLQ